VNGEDSFNEKLVKQYGITGYPVFVFTDNSGKALDMMGGAPDTGEEFKKKIQGVLSKYGG
jgi:hypothetical protein